MRTYSDFIANSEAVKIGDTWTVYVDGEKRLGAINNCIGKTEFEAKENAWDYYKSLNESLNDKNK